MRYAAGMARRAPARKARYREIEAAPEEVHRARLAEERSAELLEHTVGTYKDLQEAPYGVRIVGSMPVVLRKPDRLRQFVGHLVDGDANAECCEISHDRRIKTCDRLPGQRKLPRCAVAGRNPQGMIDKIEVDLEGAGTIRYRRGRQPAR